MTPKPTVLEFGMSVDVHGTDTLIACAAITVSIEHPEASHGVRADTLAERRGEG